jgi:hypothetical protein
MPKVSKVKRKALTARSNSTPYAAAAAADAEMVDGQQEEGGYVSLYEKIWRGLVLFKLPIFSLFLERCVSERASF